MRRSNPQRASDVAVNKRIEQLAAAFVAFRRANGAGRRIPLGLRRQFVAALDAGVVAGALGRACGVSWKQTRHWRLTAHADAPSPAAPRVLSVVDRQSAPASSSTPEGLELRVGAWRISVQRLTD
jgi:hypothetical protein